MIGFILAHLGLPKQRLGRTRHKLRAPNQRESLLWRARVLADSQRRLTLAVLSIHAVRVGLEQQRDCLVQRWAHPNTPIRHTHT
jgi:hypothetical protein